MRVIRQDYCCSRASSRPLILDNSIVHLMWRKEDTGNLAAFVFFVILFCMLYLVHCTLRTTPRLVVRCPPWQYYWWEPWRDGALSSQSEPGSLDQSTVKPCLGCNCLLSNCFRSSLIVKTWSKGRQTNSLDPPSVIMGMSVRQWFIKEEYVTLNCRKAWLVPNNMT